MFEFQQKKKIKRILYSFPTLILLALVFLFLLKAAWGVYHKEQLSQTNLERQSLELKKLSNREKDLANSIEYLKSEEGVEAEIRSKFRLAKEGESVVIIVDDESPSPKKEEPVPPPSGFWQKLLNWWND